MRKREFLEKEEEEKEATGLEIISGIYRKLILLNPTQVVKQQI